MKLAGTRSNRDAIGARVRLSAGGKTMTRQVEAGSGYASEAMLPIHFGLGNAIKIDSAEITWPSGLVQMLRGEQLDGFIDRMVRIEEGSDHLADVKPSPSLTRATASIRKPRRRRYEAGTVVRMNTLIGR